MLTPLQARQTGPPGIIGQGAPGYGMVNGGNHFHTTQLALPNSPAGLPTTGAFSTDDRTSRSFLIEDVSPKYGADVFYRVFQVSDVTRPHGMTDGFADWAVLHPAGAQYSKNQ